MRARAFLPRNWSETVRSSVLHAISCAAMAMTTAWSGSATARSGRVQGAAEADRLRAELALISEELDIKDDRWRRAPPRRRPHYGPVQRMRIPAPGRELESEGRQPACAAPRDSRDPDCAAALLAAACPGDVPLPAPSVSAPASEYSTRYSWAELLRRVFQVDVITCPSCGSRRRLIALISDPPVVRKILRHLGLAAEPPALAPPRSPPQMAFGF